MSFTFWLSSLKARVVAASARRNRNSRRSTIRQRSLLLETLEDRVVPATLLVNTNADVVNPTNGTLSLRDAISAVNAGNANGLTTGEMSLVSGTFGVFDTIEFSTVLKGDTITLSGSALAISKSVTITGLMTGLGASNLAVSGNNQSGVFTIAVGDTVSIAGLTIQDGNPRNSFGFSGDGGGISNAGTLTVINSILVDNLAESGGGIFNSGALTVNDLTLASDSATYGGGIDNNGTLTVSNSTLSNDSADNGGGGGIANGYASTATVSNSTLVGNSAPLAEGGGGIDNHGTLTVSDSTLVGNSANNGGGIANQGGEIGSETDVATLNNTIVANSTSGGDLYLSPASVSPFTGAYDLIGDGSASSSFSHSLQGNPLLAPLGNYGGPTQTLALLPGSIAIGAGSDSLAMAAGLGSDQRGQPPSVNGAVDIGAFQTQTSQLVTTPADPGGISGQLSLREALNLANAGAAASESITFASILNSNTITLDGSALAISTSVTINGLGASNLTVSGNHQSGVFTVASADTVSIAGLTIQDGNDSVGGGIDSEGTLTVSSCTLSGNSATTDGGGIFNEGSFFNYALTVSNSTLSGNSANNGGGIYDTGLSLLIVSNSTFSDNSASAGSGGGIYAYASLNVSNSTLSGNSASGSSSYGIGDGGGIFVPGSGTVGGSLRMSNCTLSANSAQGFGGGIAYTETAGPATLNNSIVANSTSGGDLAGLFTGSYDLIGDGSDSSSFSHSLQGNPLLAPLANNGGPTQTMALLPGSPALAAGSPALAVDANGNPLTTDQRGKPRIVDGSVDIGAFERQVNNSIDSLGAYRPSNGSWSLASTGTLNYNDTTTLSFNPSTNQVFFSFSPPGAIGVAGDWTGSGVTEIGDFQIVNGVGVWALDLHDNGILVPSDTFTFGQAGDTPVVGDWNGDGKTDIGVFRATPDGSGGGEFILDTNENHILDAGDATFNYGLATDRVVIGDWNGAGKSEVGVFRDAGTSGFPNDAGDAVFSLDVANHRTFDSSNQVFLFGLITDGLIVGDWNGQGKTDLGVYRDGASFAPGTALFTLDTLGNHLFGPGDAVFLYGVDTDQFVSGHWAQTPPLQPEGTPQAQFAANGPGSGGVAPLTEAQLQPVLEQAIAAWVADGASAAQLDSVPVQIGTLDDNLVGQTLGNQITLDSTADGWGWNTDTSNADFTSTGVNGLQATPGSAATGQMDLLTVVEHELGHELGLSDVDPLTHPSDLMASTLPPGVRRQPTAQELDSLFTSLGAPRS